MTGKMESAMGKKKKNMTSYLLNEKKGRPKLQILCGDSQNEVTIGKKKS